MLTFHSITWKNFLSTGNAPTTIHLDAKPTTLVVGTNGAGKSTVLDALTFALFGKPFRNVNKPQLLNSINGKNCEVALEFSVYATKYRVVRGMKPNVFEIYKDGTLLNQDAAARDYQKFLEQQILGLNYKTFTQVVILGSASFVPFMQLPVGQRREVIEDILDISVFSRMNQLLKEKMTKTKDELTSIDNEISIAKAAVGAQKKLISTMQHSKKDQIEALKKQIADNQRQIDANIAEADSLTTEIEALTEELPHKKEHDKMFRVYSSASAKHSAEVSRLQGVLEFFQENTTCPTCEQGISHSHRELMVESYTKAKTENQEQVDVADENIRIINKINKRWTELNEKIQGLNTRCTVLNHTNATLLKANKKVESEIQTLENNTVDVDAERKILKETAEKAMVLIDRRAELNEEKTSQEVAAILLKDTGIKTAIIREYLPAMNRLINGYLTAMDLFIHFELDEAFNEVIRSRFRDEFTYDSFSEGEKQKIDIAILFAWRQIAKMKNSVNTNLLLFDEIFDSSLDSSGTDYLMGLLNSLGDKTNVFVISHKTEALVDKFHDVIRFEKKNDFSVVD